MKPAVAPRRVPIRGTTELLVNKLVDLILGASESDPRFRAFMDREHERQKEAMRGVSRRSR